MKEAIASTLLFKLVLVFLVAYIGIMAIGINYAITFRHKNQIVSLIEKFEGYEHAKPAIAEYLESVKYVGAKYNTTNNTGTNCENSRYGRNVDGFCVERVQTPRGDYYIVTTYMNFDFPIIGKFLNAPIKGETSVIYNLNTV